MTRAPARGGHEMAEPVLLAEILPPNDYIETRANIWSYTTLPGLREILVVPSTRIEVELFRRDDAGDWPAQPIVCGDGETLRIASIDLALPVRALYRTTSLVPG